MCPFTRLFGKSVKPLIQLRKSVHSPSKLYNVHIAQRKLVDIDSLFLLQLDQN